MAVASTTVLQLSVGELVSVGLFVLGALYALAQVIVSLVRKSMDQRFANIDARFTTLEATTAALGATNSLLEREVEQLNRQLPLEYVRREDWIRFSASIDMKLDRLAAILMQRSAGGGS